MLSLRDLSIYLNALLHSGKVTCIHPCVKQPEAKLKAHLKDGFSSVFATEPLFWWPTVASMMQPAGVPDLYAVARGSSTWIEAKVNGNGLSKIQALVQSKMAMAGARVIILHADLRVDESVRRIDWTRIDSKGVCQYIPSHLSWNDVKTSEFWTHVLYSV